MNISELLIEWYTEHKRNLPWRNTRNPYKIWLSEIILQQTRVEQGLSYYYKFTAQFKDCKSLAMAAEDDVLKLWQGLGYYSRARNLHKAAKQIQEEFNGIFPSTYKDIISLKGVGDYTASAIASFAFDLPHAVVDGNVYRFLSRIYGIDTPIDTSAGKKTFAQTAASVLDEKQAATHNQAIMEFGAMLCTPKNPDCANCPFAQECYARKNQCADKLPVKSKKIKQRNRFFYYLYINNDNGFYITKRTAKDIWQNLYELPLIESDTKLSPEEVFQNKLFQSIFENIHFEVMSTVEMKAHKLSHQTIYATFIAINIVDNRIDIPEFLHISKEKMQEYAIPKLIENYFKN